MRELPLILPLAEVDAGAIVGAIIMIVVVLFGILNSAKEAKQKKLGHRAAGGGASALDERIRRRQAERRGEQYGPVIIDEGSAIDDRVEVDEDDIPTSIGGVRLSPEDRQAIARARREQAEEERYQAEVNARARREQEEIATQRRETQARRERAEARTREEREQREQQQQKRRRSSAKSAKSPAVARGEIGAGGGEIGSGSVAPSARRSNARADRLRKLLRQPDTVKTVIIASEVLGKPVSLRDA